MNHPPPAAPAPALADSLRARAVKRFGRPPELVLRVPGRVDLLGSHTDYNDLPVLACAIPQALYAAAIPLDCPRAEAHNLDPDAPPGSFPVAAAIPPSPIGHWLNYLKAGTRGAVVHHQPNLPDHGWHALFTADLPRRAGLSSSSALVVAAGLLTEAANGWQATPRAQAAYLAEAEHYVGTQGGALDHTTILCGQEGHVLRIDFAPLVTRPIPFPAGLALAVCHCGRDAGKTAAARAEYNRRVLECRLGAAQLARGLALADHDEILAGGLTLGGLLGRAGITAAGAASTWPQLVVEPLMSVADIAHRLGIAADDLARAPILRAGAEALTIPGDGLLPARRVAHVLGEAARVEAAAAALLARDLPALAEQVNGSYRSARDLYAISSAELDALIAHGLEAGALGARIAGAGFGGCALFLVPADEIAGWSQLMDRTPAPVGPRWLVHPAAPAGHVSL